MGKSERFSVKFFSEFLHTPRPIANIPGVGQMSFKQMLLSLGLGLLVGGLVNIFVGPLLFFVTFLAVAAGSILVLSKEQDHIQIGERMLAAILYQLRARFAPEELIFIPDSESFVTADVQAHRPVLTLDADNRVVSVHRGGH